MKETAISELQVHCLDGEFYDETRKYLEKQGCIWKETRTGDQLETVHLEFPPGTIYKQDKHAYEVRFPKGGMLWWSVKPDGENRISEIGRASCRERGVDLGGRRIIKKKKYREWRE